MSARRIFSTLGAIAFAAACAKDPAPSTGTLSIVTGKETDALTRAPLPARLLVSMRTGTAAPQTIADLVWPVSDFELGSLATASQYSFTAELRDASGVAVLRGETPAVSGAELAAGGLTLLVGRVGEPMRPSAGLASPWPSPRVTALGRYAFVASPDGTSSELYDFVALAALKARTVLPRRPASIASADGAHVLLVDDAGATLLDVGAGTSADADLGGVVATDLVGGSAIVGDDGTYLVGAARTSGAATRAVLRLALDGTIRAVPLSTPRVGAFVAWAPGAGLVVGGGAPGAAIEILASGGASFSASAASYGGSGGAAVALGDGSVIVVGGVDEAGAPRGSARLTLACGSACTAMPLGESVDVASGAGFTGTTGNGFVVGTATDGATVVLRVSGGAASTTVDVVPLRVPRHGGAPVSLGGGYVAILGGTDASGVPVADVEILTPP